MNNVELSLQLAELIKKYIKEDFEDVHLSGNLMDTITVSYDSGKYYVEVPAKIYDVDLFLRDKVIVYTGEGSYAQDVNETGGLSGKHTNYVDKAIISAVDEWIKTNNLNVKEFEVI